MLKQIPVPGTKRAGYIIFWLLLPLALFPLFWQLGSIPIYGWDEARLAINAAEMSDNGNLIVTYYKGEPDMWNTKPPLMIWLQALCLKLFGFSEMAIRLPSALAAAGTCLLLVYLCLKLTATYWAGLFSAFVLVTTPGYMGHHVARTGDYDALLTFFTTAYFIFFFLYLEKSQRKYLIYFTLALTLAALTKGIGGLVPAPALFLYALFRKKIGFLLTQKEVYLAAASFMLVLAGYYLGREALNPGYLKAVMENELGGRYLATLEGHNHPASFFITMLFDWKLIPWLFLFPAAACLNLFSENPLVRRFTLLALLFIGVLLLIISTAQTKLPWYDAPAFPMIATISGLGIFGILDVLYRNYFSRNTTLFFCLALFLLFSIPYYRIISKYLREKSESYSSHPGNYFGPALKDLHRQQPEVRMIQILREEGKNPTLDFYKYGYAKKGMSFEEVYPQNIDTFSPGQVVVTCDAGLREQLLQKYETTTLYWFHSCANFKIISRKQ